MDQLFTAETSLLLGGALFLGGIVVYTVSKWVVGKKASTCKQTKDRGTQTEIPTITDEMDIQNEGEWVADHLADAESVLSLDDQITTTLESYFVTIGMGSTVAMPLASLSLIAWRNKDMFNALIENKLRSAEIVNEESHVKALMETFKECMNG